MADQVLGPTPLNRQELEARWRQRLDVARLRLQFAHTYVKEVQRDLQQGSVPSADGNVALERAQRSENVAVVEYNRVLGIFTDLVVAGKIPDKKPARGGALSATG